MTVILQHWQLVTARIFYRRPDHLWLLQEYFWQDIDAVPNLPALHKFLCFWQEKLEGPIHSVVVTNAEIEFDNLRNAGFTETLQ